MRFHAFICQVLKIGWIPYNISANKTIRYPKMQSQYKIAVIDENNEIVKIYPQSEYNALIIEQYKGQPQSLNDLTIEQANQTTVDTLNAMTQSFENTTQQAKIQNEQAIAQINQSINHGVTQTNSVLYSVATLFIVLTLVFVFVKVLIGGKDKNSK